jgi:hypothetical protein
MLAKTPIKPLKCMIFRSSDLVSLERGINEWSAQMSETIDIVNITQSQSFNNSGTVVVITLFYVEK